ncbi:hypothetical protein D9M71_207750 [compost metagenome]
MRGQSACCATFMQGMGGNADQQQRTEHHHRDDYLERQVQTAGRRVDRGGQVTAVTDDGLR